MFGLIRRWRRSRLRKRAIPKDWFGHLDRRVPFFQHFSAEQQELFLERLRLFVWEKHWIGAGGMVITDEVRVVFSAAAVRLTLYLGENSYNDLTEIVVYPSHYRHPGNREAVVLGEAHHWGTVVLSWDAVISGLADDRDGHDTATHEFAHVLDGNDGQFDGTPELRAREHLRPWATIMSRHFLALRDGQRNERRVLRNYGATNEAEFFAVATESFFEKPTQMRKRTPQLYDELSQFYGFDPCAETAARKESG